MKKINIIGMGELGKEIYDAIDKEIDTQMMGYLLYGTDVSTERVAELKMKGYEISNTIVPDADVYIISAYLTEQVFSILNQIELCYEKPSPLVSIESTLEPSAVEDLKTYSKKFDIVLFPHRFNPNDPEHHIFNLDRIMGGFREVSVNVAWDFFRRFMDYKKIHITTAAMANLVKPAENWYRFAEIVLAQELRKACEYKGVDFEVLRKLMRTKWNIDIKSAQQGVGGKCLPKDSALVSNFFDTSDFFDFIHYKNEEYIQWYVNQSKENV